MRDQMKALEGPKENFDCFQGIVDPTDCQVSWGTWLDSDKVTYWEKIFVGEPEIGKTINIYFIQKINKC